MYAIVEIAGKQFKVRENDRLYVPKQAAEPEEKISFDRVLLVANDADVTVGAPTVDGASVEATVLTHVKADKVLVFKKKRRKRFRVKRGHRQPYTEILIDGLDLTGKAKKSTKKAKPAPKAAAAAETVAEAPPVAEAPAAKKAASEKAPAAKKAAAAEKAPAKKAAAKKAPAETQAAEKAPAKKATAAKPAKKKAAAKKTDGDDLKKIEGIGPKISSILTDAGVPTFAAMASSTPDRLREILAEAGPRYNRANPDTWPEQAALADAGEWDKLDKLQDELKGGRREE